MTEISSSNNNNNNINNCSNEELNIKANIFSSENQNLNNKEFSNKQVDSILSDKTSNVINIENNSEKLSNEESNNIINKNTKKLIIKEENNKDNVYLNQQNISVLNNENKKLSEKFNLQKSKFNSKSNIHSSKDVLKMQKIPGNKSKSKNNLRNINNKTSNKKSFKKQRTKLNNVNIVKQENNSINESYEDGNELYNSYLNDDDDADYDEDEEDDDNNNENNNNDNIHNNKYIGNKVNSNIVSEEDYKNVNLAETNVVRRSIIQNKKPKIINKLKYILEHWITTVMFSIITVWVLFADDIKLLTTTNSADPLFSILNIVFMIMFAVEFLISSMVVDNYYLSFFFWLDLVSTLSMILDIHWLYSDVDSKIKTATNITKVGRGARVGSRAVKVLRILRILRLVRIAKLYKASQKLGDKDKNSKVLNNVISNKNTNDIAPPEESKVGKKLTDVTTKRVIIIILSLILGVILFNSNLYYSTLSSTDFSMKVFDELKNPYDSTVDLVIQLLKEEFPNNSTTPLLYVEVTNRTYGYANIENELRSDEKLTSESACEHFLNYNSSARCYAIFDNRYSTKITSIINISKTIFICIALTCASIFFNKDTSELVLDPIESMMIKIDKISKNPIEAMEENEKQDYLKFLDERRQQRSNQSQNIFFKLGCKCFEKKNGINNAPLETVVLEKTITKIGALMALGFGEAGSKIVISNMNKAEDSINPLIKGKKVMAIYGFCDIRNFTDTTEILEEQVMIFVNEIAEIVHGITVEYGGSANKNIGDAFLLVWKFENDMCEYNEKGELIGLKKNNKAVSEMVDSSVIAFLKILAKVHKSFVLDKYRNNVGLNNRLKNYSVKMGFGLHLGWSIEGAIGSTFKIDASYLSPHVNVSGKLEEKTKEYGALIIISQDLVSYMSEEARINLRPIDYIKLIDERFMNIYTVDIALADLKIESEESQDMEEDKLLKFQIRNERKQHLINLLNGETNQWKDYEEFDEDWAVMRSKYSDEFFIEYKKGFDNYVIGNWKEAKINFEEAINILGDSDKPSKRFIDIIVKYNYVKPEDWNGEIDD